MSTLNKIFYGPAGTGKTREAIKEAVKIVSKSEKLNLEYSESNYDDIQLNFKQSTEIPDLQTKDINIINKVKDFSKTINEVADSLSAPEMRKLVGADNREKAQEVIKEYRAYPFIETVTFHPSYCYQDFVEGIGVETKGVSIEYKPKDGIFKKICDRAIQNNGYKYVLIIDEINRGDISSIFGELFTLLEDSKREGEKEELSINLPYSKDKNGNPLKLIVPNNLHILATMNTVDKSIALIDVALRRRFDFIEMKPDYTSFSNVSIDGIDLVKMLKVINERITILKNEHYQIGHSYFLKIENFDDLKRVMTKNIIPLLQEYFYDDWQSICAVLNQPYEKSNNENGLFEIKKADDEMFSNEFKDLIEFNNKRLVTIRDFEVDDIKSIY